MNSFRVALRVSVSPIAALLVAVVNRCFRSGTEEQKGHSDRAAACCGYQCDEGFSH